MSKGSFLLTMLLCALGTTSQAQEFRWDLEWYNSAQSSQRNQSSLIDPTGQRIDNPEARFETDLRINTKYTWQNGTRLVIRPRLVGDYNQFHYSSPDTVKNTTTGTASLPEAYIEGDLSRKMAVAVGLQNYQWGPAEFISPSNPFYHFNPRQRAYNFKEDGHFLMRMNWSPNSLWSVIGLVEPVNNGNSFWIYEQKFKPKGAIKIERRGDNALNYFGFDAGTIDDDIPFIGEYFNVEAIQGLSFYLDARHSNGYAQYKPELSPDTLYDMYYVKKTGDWKSLVATGMRWEGSVDVRLEYVYNSYGLTKEDLQFAFLSALPLHPRANQNLKKLLGSGMELFGQHYGYLSLRIPDLFVQNNNLSFRYVRSLMDQSASLQTAYDTAIGDAWTLFAELSVSIGDNTQELSALEKSSGALGFKWNL
jgi:hypothetical protein